MVRQESARPGPRPPPLRPGCRPPSSNLKRSFSQGDPKNNNSSFSSSSSGCGGAAPAASSSAQLEASGAHGKKRKSNDDSIATASVYKENYSNFLSNLTKEQGVNYKMKRARG